MEAPKTLQEAIIHFSNFDNCKTFMVDLRWPDGKVACPRCGSEKVTWLAKPRVWKCYGKHESPTFSLKTGTIFEESAIPLEKWLPAVWLLVTCKNGISSYEVHRDLGISQKSAWHLMHRIRFALHAGSFEKMLSGHVEADETFIGGKARNMHVAQRRRRITGTGTKDKRNAAARFVPLWFPIAKRKPSRLRLQSTWKRAPRCIPISCCRTRVLKGDTLTRSWTTPWSTLMATHIQTRWKTFGRCLNELSAAPTFPWSRSICSGIWMSKPIASTIAKT